MTERTEHRTWWEAPAVFALFAVLYIATAATTLLGGDAGEFAVIFADGGTAHPPGYPLYSMYLRAFSWLPLESPAHGASVATALLGAAAVALLYAAARAWGCDRMESTFGTLAVGLAPHLWLYHTSPEVFALNNAVAAAIFWAAAPGAPIRGTGRIAALGLLAGLGLSNHHTIVLVAPIGLWGVYRGLVETEASRTVALGAGLGALLLALVPYGYLPYVAVYDTGWRWDEPTSFGNVVEVVLRRNYGTFQMTAQGGTVDPFGQLALFARTVPLDLHIVPVLVAVLGVAKLLATGMQSVWEPQHSYIAALSASFLLSGPLFVTLLTLDFDGVGTVLLRRFHLLPELQIGLLGALGAAAFRGARPRHSIALVILAALALAAAPRIWSTKQQHQSPAVEQYVRDTFETLPDDAIVLGMGDHNFFGALYLRRALGRRSDIDYIDAFLLAHRWYVDRVDRRLERSLPHTGSSIDTDEILSRLVATGRPVFVTDTFTEGLLEGWRAVPRGTTIRVFGSEHTPPSPPEVYRRNEQLYESFQIAVPSGASNHTWRRLVLDDYAVTWDRIADVLRRSGHPTLAERAARRASAFRPWDSDGNR